MTSADWIAPAIGIFGSLWAWFRHRDAKLTDAERADLLERLASDAAAVVLAAFPGKAWAEYVNMIVTRLLAMPGVPTKNAAALEGAANSALVRLQAVAKGSPVVSAEIRDRTKEIVAGAVVGVLGTLLLLASLVEAGDAHYVTRKEYDATLTAIKADLDYLRQQADAHTGRVRPDAP